MAKTSKAKVAAAVMAEYGGTYASALGIALERNTPAPLFQMLCASLLFGARISADNASRAMRALLDARLSTPRAVAAATWQERVDVLTTHGYKRFDERTSTRLGELAHRVLEEYGGDLRRLRERAERKVDRERALLEEFKGIGDIGADIFLREIQLSWPEVYPFADEKVLKAARALGLGNSPAELARFVDRAQFPSLVAGLVRIDIGHAYDNVVHAA